MASLFAALLDAQLFSAAPMAWNLVFVAQSAPVFVDAPGFSNEDNPSIAGVKNLLRLRVEPCESEGKVEPLPVVKNVLRIKVVPMRGLDNVCVLLQKHHIRFDVSVCTNNYDKDE